MEAPDWSPDDLAAKVREQRKPTVEDGAARRAARELRFWWNRDRGMLDGRFSMPDVDGAVVERLRAPAKVEPVLVGDDNEPIVVGRMESVLSEKVRRVVRQRDGKCRWPGCDQRVGLEVHHLWPSSCGDDEIWNLATVCWTHHHQLAPQGAFLLLGNPNNPAGLSLIDRDDLPQLATLAADHARAP